MNQSITLRDGYFGWDYVIEHDDGRTLLVQSDWDCPGIASTFGWSACAKCRRECRGATDGTIDCPRCKTMDHIRKAQDWLDAHIGKRVADPGYFDFD
jgi:hypothetical protein